MKYYIPRQITPKQYELAVFKDHKEPENIYILNINSCNCPGFYRQKDKTQHKHIQLLKFWIKNLEKNIGYMLWFDKNDIEYRRFLTSKWKF